MPVHPAVVAAQRDFLAGTEKVLEIHAGVNQRAIGIGIPDAEHEIVYQAFLDAHIDVHLVGRARHGRCLDVYILEKSETLQAHARTLHLRGREPGAFHLPEFTPHYVVIGRQVSAEIYTPHIHPLAGIDEEGEGHRAPIPIDTRADIDIRTGIPTASNL